MTINNSDVSCPTETTELQINLFLYLPMKYLFFSELFQFRIFFSLSCVFSSVQSRSHVQLFATPWTAELQASLSITNSQSLLKLIFTGSVMPYNHLILCLPLLLRPQSFPASGSFPMSQFFASGGQSIRVSVQHQSFQ